MPCTADKFLVTLLFKTFAIRMASNNRLHLYYLAIQKHSRQADLHPIPFSARRHKCKRIFYSSSACVYPEHIQLDPNNPGLKEDTAWPARPQDGYGLEKLYAEEMYISYGKELGIETRIGRFHNIYGPVHLMLHSYDRICHPNSPSLRFFFVAFGPLILNMFCYSHI
jgi:hypothetical protein